MEYSFLALQGESCVSSHRGARTRWTLQAFFGSTFLWCQCYFPSQNPQRWLSVKCRMTRPMTVFASSSFGFSGRKWWVRSESLEVCFGVMVLGWLIDAKIPPQGALWPTPGSIPVLKGAVWATTDAWFVWTGLQTKTRVYFQSFHRDLRLLRSNLGGTQCYLNLSAQREWYQRPLRAAVQIKWKLHVKIPAPCPAHTKY